MPKGYIVANIRAHDTEGIARFAQAAAPVIAEYGGRVLARDPAPEVCEGTLQGISVLIEFDDVATARAFYASKGYTDAKAIRQASAETDLCIVEGV